MWKKTGYAVGEPPVFGMEMYCCILPIWSCTTAKCSKIYSYASTWHTSDFSALQSKLLTWKKSNDLWLEDKLNNGIHQCSWFLFFPGRASILNFPPRRCRATGVRWKLGQLHCRFRILSPARVLLVTKSAFSRQAGNLFCQITYGKAWEMGKSILYSCSLFTEPHKGSPSSRVSIHEHLREECYLPSLFFGILWKCRKYFDHTWRETEVFGNECSDILITRYLFYRFQDAWLFPQAFYLMSLQFFNTWTNC